MRCLTRPRVFARATAIAVRRVIRRNKLEAAVLAACAQTVGDAVPDAHVSSALHGTATLLTTFLTLL